MFVSIVSVLSGGISFSDSLIMPRHKGFVLTVSYVGQDQSHNSIRVKRVFPINKVENTLSINKGELRLSINKVENVLDIVHRFGGHIEGSRKFFGCGSEAIPVFAKLERYEIFPIKNRAFPVGRTRFSTKT